MEASLEVRAVAADLGLAPLDAPTVGGIDRPGDIVSTSKYVTFALGVNSPFDGTLT